MANLGPRGVFAERFALLYAEAGDPPLKRVTESVARARRTDEQGRPVRVPAQRVSDWRRGRNVPARFTALSAVLEILIGEARKIRPEPAISGLYDMDAWRSLWEEAQASPVDEESDSQPDEATVCPYRGLAAFRPEDSNWFFGRERSTNALLDRLDGSGILMLVGASGAGKSSLMKAGLLPALNKSAILMTPGTDPLKELAHQIPELSETLIMATELVGMDHEVESDDAHGQCMLGSMRFANEIQEAVGDRVLIVDQFEEAFTLGGDEHRLRVFVQALHAAAAGTSVVLGVRADFYARCLDYPELAEALQDRQMVLGPMTAAELREAVANPAKGAGLQLETGLVELMLRDLGVQSGRRGRGQEAYDAGALPLLSHALLATWQRRQAGRLTIAGYRAAGGIQGAVAATAERAWSDLEPSGQVAARPMLLRLVRVGDDTQDTRRRSSRKSLIENTANPTATEDALEVLARARLITLDAGSVEITHEALLHAWPRLRSWIDEDRAGNLLRQRLEEDAATWSGHERDSSLLYRGARLETAKHGTSTADLTAVAREFVAASEQQRRRAAWFRRSAVALVVVFAMIAASAAVIAVRQRNDAVFRQVVAEADRLVDTDPSLSAQLALVAHRMRPDDQGVRAKLTSTQHTPLATPLTGHTGAIYLTSFRRDGNVLATASYDNTARLWDVRDRTKPTPLATLAGHTSWVSSAVFSPDGNTLATTGDDKTIRLWDVTDPANPKSLGIPLEGKNGTTYLLEFSPDGHTLAAANEDRSARLWDVRNPAAPVPLGQPLTGHTSPVRSLAFSPDGRTLATTGDDKTIRLWNVTDPANAVALGAPLTGHSEGLHTLAFSPDSRMLASGSDDRTVRLWNVADPTRAEPLGTPLTGHTDAVWSVKFRPDGRALASGGSDSTARLWNVSDPAHGEPLGPPLSAQSSGVFAVGFSPDGRSLATGSEDGVARLWSLPGSVMVGHTASVGDSAFSPDGQVLVTVSNDKTIGLWNVSDPANPKPLGKPLTGHTKGVWQIRFRPDGRLLASGSGDKTVRLWDVSDWNDPKAVGEPIMLNTRFAAPVAFSPDGKILITGNDDHSVRLWDVTDPAKPVPLGEPLTGHSGYVNTAVFTPDGRTLVTASSDKTIRLWNVSDPRRVTLKGQPLAGHTGPVNRAVVSPDGKTIASVSGDRTLRIWDLATGSAKTLNGHAESVGSVAFSADGAMIATSSEDATIRLWDVADPSIVQSVTAHAVAGYRLAFSPHGRVLASGSGDNLLRLWDLDSEHAAERICATTRGVLTPERWQRHLPQLPYEPPC